MSTQSRNQTHGRHKRPFLTQYFTDSDASGKKPASVGYAASVRGARKNMAVRIVLGQYGLAVVVERDTRDVLSTMRRTKAGMNIKDTEPSRESNSLTMLEESTK